MTETVLTEEERVELACDWTDYRNQYGADASEHKAFVAGWTAGRHGEQSGVLR